MDARSISDAGRKSGSGSIDTALLDRALFQSYLEPGEEILWMGRPGHSPGPWRFQKTSTPAGRFIVAVGIVIGLVGLVGAWSDDFTLGHPDWAGLPSYVVAAAAIGVFFAMMFAILCGVTLITVAISPLLLPLRRRMLQDLVYALTDQRALVKRRSTAAAPEMASYDSVNKPKVRLRENGSGDVTFGYRGGLKARWGRAKLPNKSQLLFENIGDAAQVFRLAEAALEHRVHEK